MRRNNNYTPMTEGGFTAVETSVIGGSATSYTSDCIDEGKKI